ncbi:MAG: iron ABC transporter permease [Proteobacteria bacterium]|nr:iron ABC transporter permease [Pseudomonadota bacterium]
MAPGSRAASAWLAVAIVAVLLLPWYALPASILDPGWLTHWGDRDTAPLALQATLHGRPWLWACVPWLALAAWGLQRTRAPRVRAALWLAAGVGGVAATLVQGFLITLPHAGAAIGGQPGFGAGASMLLAAYVAFASLGLAARGAFGGDGFVAGTVVGIASLVALFTFYPLLRIGASALAASDGTFAPLALVTRLATAKVWGLGCIAGHVQCGVVWNTLALGLACAVLCTLLGLAFALLVTRTASRWRRALRALAVLPMITPPFVIGLALVLLFGRAGVVNHALEGLFGVEPGRWFYGYTGVLVAQTFAFTPLAFLIVVGVVEGVAPSLEEAAQTLHANPWRTFVDVSVPLMRPGLANAFLIAFLESIADFGNPIILGGNLNVLATEIFFSVVGAQLDPGRAASLGLLLLVLALGAFVAQRAVLGRRSYVALGGKGDGGYAAPLPSRVRRGVVALAVPWVLLTVALYVLALGGGFVETWGRDWSLTLRHYRTAFGLEWTAQGLLWTGAAWGSLWTTLRLSALAAPLTAGLGLLAAWVLARQRFAGRGVFELATLLSFAIPGTVIGVAYILAFNVPPFELTGTALILVLCNVFRNMPVGVRAGVAAMAQIDPSLDEAAMTLRARSTHALRTVLAPLLKPAIVAALAYSFVRAMTTVSAVIFLISARYEWSTTYIINRVVNGDYGVALAYCAVLIVLMIVAVAGIQRVVGERRLGRRGAAGATAASLAAAG